MMPIDYKRVPMMRTFMVVFMAMRFWPLPALVLVLMMLIVNMPMSVSYGFMFVVQLRRID